MGKKKILIAGYFGMGNLGDELILDITLKNLKNRLAERCKISVLSGDPASTSKNFNVSAVNRKNPFSILKTLISSDVLIVGGGGLFQDKTSTLSLYYYLSLLLFGKILRKKVVVYAVGVDKLKRMNSYITKIILNMADSISVRDAASYDFLTGGKMGKKVILSADAVLTHKPAVASSDRKKKTVFAFVLNGFNSISPDFWARIADNCVVRFNVAIKFIVFDKRKDSIYTEGVKKLMRNPSDIVMWQNTSDALGEFEKIGMVISMRLHGMILASIFGIPVCGISDSAKAELFLKEIEQKNIYRLLNFKEHSEETVMGIISDIWRRSDEFMDRCFENVKRLRKLALSGTEAVFACI